MPKKKNGNNGNGNENQMQAVSVRFIGEVERQFAEEMGNSIRFDDHQKRLAQHLFLKADSSLKEFEKKRLNKNQKDKLPFKWENINMRKLALEAVFKISLGLDALIPNHIHPVPYYNSKNQKYDLDLQTGYDGLDYYKRKHAIEEPKDVRYELVYETDTYKPIKKCHGQEIEDYEFVINNPFERGEIIGGFGYIAYDDPTKNKLIIVTDKDFQESQEKAPSPTFWSQWPERMKYKTVVRRTTDKIKIDPEKANARALFHEESSQAEQDMQRQIEENANSEVFDIEPEPAEEEPEQKIPQTDKPQKTEKAESQPEPKPQPEKEKKEEEKEQTPKQENLFKKTGTEGPDF